MSLPNSLWDTYSAFANCYGGIILLGVKENKDGSWQTTGLQNAAKLQKEFWDIINNPKKVSINLLREDDVQVYNHNGDIIITIQVPAARREQKPVYINNDMFGNEYDIVRQFPDYFLDYRALLNPNIRWTDRVHSSSGDWSGNLFDFYFRVYNKLTQSLNVPFKLSGVARIDDTPMHEAIREALANCLINADYFGSRGVVITLQQKSITFANPGYSRTGKIQMLRGGISDPRNRGLMKMFNLVDIGERAGSGIPKIITVWKDEDLVDPVIEEEFDPDRTILTLSLEKNER